MIRRAWPLLLSGCLGCADYGTDFERMLDQEKYEPYEANAFFADGRAMRRPPEGTVAREAISGPPELLQGGRGARYVSAIPLPVTRALVERGQNRFRIFCAACHGREGDGVSQVAENMRLRPPPSLHEARLRELPAGALFRVITQGYGLMPSYAAQLDVHDRWAVVAFVQALQLSRNVRLSELPPELRKEAGAWLR